MSNDRASEELPLRSAYPSAADIDELRRVAAVYLGSQRDRHILQPTALVNEAFLKLAHASSTRWKSARDFRAAAAQAMRQILVDYARREAARKRGQGWQRVELRSIIAYSNAPTVDVLDLDDALTRLAREHPEAAGIVELRIFGGLTIPEVAEYAGVSESTVSARWRLAEAWLRRALGEGAPRASAEDS